MEGRKEKERKEREREGKKQRKKKCQALKAHTCHPNYLGGRDQEDHGSSSPWANSLQDLISKIPNTKKAGRVVQVWSTCLASSRP
jgi:hypothetical protein